METNRRNFIKSASVIAASAASIGLVNQVIADASKPNLLGELTSHTLPELPYAYDALEPYIDAETMRIHHQKHHQGYVNGLNKAEEELAKARAEGDYSLIEHWSKKAAFNGGGHFLHSLFWRVMGPEGKIAKEPQGELRKKISQDFGSFESFKKHFSAAANAVEGSGWAMLHYRPQDKRLIILQGENQHKLTTWGSTPILVLDVWEHAYYLKYKNMRTDYVTAWWNVVNWKEVEKSFSDSAI